MESQQDRDIIDIPLVELDFIEFRLEGLINSYFSLKGFPLRIKNQWITDDVLIFKINGYQIALYIKSLKKLYRLSDCLNLHWVLIRSAIKQTDF
jgi:hypothetical protein